MKNILLLIVVSYFKADLFSQPLHIVGKGKEIDPFHYTITKSIQFKNAAVVCANPLAAKVGVEILKRGGNAFDAAIAVNLALEVVYPDAGNIGGGGLMTARKSDGTLIALDFRETAPSHASRDMYLDEEGNVQNDLSLNGHLSVGVPGSVAGFFAMHQYAKLPFKELIQPAIDLAQQGFAISKRQAEELNDNKNDFIKYNTKPVAFVKNNDWKEGDILIQKDLAQTLIRIRDNGAKGFYEGETANLLIAEMQRGKGLITKEDLKNYVVKQRTTVTFNYRGYEIAGFPPPSSGGILLAQIMKMVEKFPLQKDGFESVKATQVMIEAERRAYADRAEHLGDPDFWKVATHTLISNDYLEKRMKDYDSSHASKSADIKAGIIHESDETTHISIFDKEGNMVSITTTLNNSYGSKTVVGGAGFLLNDEMDDFSVKPGVPNLYGAVGGAANAIEPNKRMLSSMCPALVLKNGKPFIVVGTPGGTTIPTSVFQTISDIIDFGMTAAQSIAAPKFHHQWLPDEVQIEKEFPADTKAVLEKMGYTFKTVSGLGRMEVIKLNENGINEAAADIRGDDCAEGY